MKKILLIFLNLSILSFALPVDINTFLSEKKDIKHKILSINDINLTKEEIYLSEEDLNMLFIESCSFDFETNEFFCGFKKLESSSKKDFEDLD